MKIKGGIFDMDGTLVDSMPVWDSMAEDILKKYSLSVPPDANERFRAMTTPEAGAYLCQCGAPGTPEELAAEITSMVEDFYKNRAEAKPGAAEYLKALRNRGVKLLIATANERDMTEAALKSCFLFDYFDAIITCTEAGLSKTDPEFFAYCLRALGTPAEETWVYEDMLHAARSAKAAGLKVAGVYDAVSQKYCPGLRDETDIFIDTYENEGV